MAKDLLLTKLLGVILKSRRFFVKFNNKKSRVRLQRNGLLQGSVLAPLLYNIYANDQRWAQVTLYQKRIATKRNDRFNQ